jgi:isoleucyl-tRNA synthetase
MQLAQIMSSSILSLRKKEKIRVRQPLASALVAVSNEETRQALERSKEIILGETNLKGLEFLSEDSDMLSKKAKPNFKIISEENGTEDNKDKNNTWIIDPIDGTVNFLHGIPHFAISLALKSNDEIAK